MTATTWLTPDVGMIRVAWEAINQPGDIREIRIPDPKDPVQGRRRFYGTQAGWFNNADAVIRAIGDVNGDQAESIYLTVNPTDPELMARVHNRITSARATTADENIVRLTYLFIDTDADRLAKIPATDEEKAAAIAVRDALVDYLTDLYAWPAPYMVGDSGNGGALLYRVDLENTPENSELLGNVLEALAESFPAVDETTYNPARIMKLPGTIAAKGDGLDHRPHRRSSATFNPDAGIVTREMLNAVAGDKEPSTPPAARNGHYYGPTRSWTIEEFLRANDLQATEKVRSYGRTYALDRCLTSGDHTDGAVIIERHNGAIGYRCHHNRCAGKNWHYLKEHGLIRIPGADSGPTLNLNSQVIAGGNQGETSSANSVVNVVSVVPETPTETYPDPPDAAVYQGFTGEIIRAIEPDTEADPVGLLLTLLAAVGNIAGRGPHWQVGTRPHHLRNSTVLVGETSKARKGTSLSALRPVLRIATRDSDRDESTYVKFNITNGLSSGEGLIWAVRDPIHKTEAIKEKGQVVGYQDVMVDPGVDDKRLLVIEEEFASVLKVMGRDGNTLSPIIRQAWDDGDLRTMTKNSPAIATAAHITIIGHVTRDELRRHLTSTEMGNGFANRFIWACVRRSKLLPDGGAPDPGVIHALGDQLGHVLETAEYIGLIERDDDARELWHEVYGPLSEGGTGLLGAITSRAEAQVMRLAATYAVLDESHLITVEHLTAALKLWEYIEASARYIFGDSLGDPVADTILDALRSRGEMTRTDIRDLFARNQTASRIDNALASLNAAGLATPATRSDGPGRPTEIWAAT